MLNDKELKELAISSKLITPFIKENCAGATINITLSSSVKYYNSQKSIILGEKIDDSSYTEVDISTSNFDLQPNQSVLVQSEEYFKIPKDMSSIIIERYSIKLLGLSIGSPSYMNPGFEGKMSFIATNLNSVPIRLVKGIKFAQVSLFKLSSNAEKPYNKQNHKYMGEKEVSTSKIHLDYDIQEFLNKKGISNISEDTTREFGDFLMSQINKSAENIVKNLSNKLNSTEQK